MNGPMTPLQKIAMGLVIVALDTLGGYDALPDFLGWALVLWGLATLPTPARGTLQATAAVAGAVSLVLWFPQVHQPLRDAEVSLRWAASLPDLLFVLLLCRALATRAREADPTDRRFAARFGVLAWAAVVVAALPAIADAAGSDGLLVAAEVGFVVLWLWLVWNLFAAHGREYARPPVTTR
ncbi:hypothetical protein [Nocardioides donggukensis]|uniref:Uncharacterized protein n=1 Tax=Nocardioides donggukensis TaxID=2774019 RepID=A0A927Q013_9ACTN|nr:hypothetical protein [Nocardioides donggukensis]MBD8871033.1 hypothetical protein [Nocardioides donggukensis]